jgi:uncharacterized RDD family membrane protein YckC
MSGLAASRHGRAIEPSGASTTRYAGLATRVVAFAVDAALIDLAAVVVAAAAALIVSLLHFPKGLQTVLVVIGAVAYVLWSLAYFAGFWSTTGQTPGARVMQIRVVSENGERLKLRRTVLRCVGVVLAALPLFAGFVRILFDSRRRGFQDRLAGTLVVEAPQLSIAATRRLKQRAAYDASKRLSAPAAGEFDRSSISSDDSLRVPPDAALRRPGGV